MAQGDRNTRFRIFKNTRRAIRLEIEEPIKTPIIESKWTALGYASIHIPPATVALYLIIINLSGHYIGEHLGNADNDGSSDGIILAFIQIFAKVQVRTTLATFGRNG